MDFESINFEAIARELNDYSRELQAWLLLRLKLYGLPEVRAVGTSSNNLCIYCESDEGILGVLENLDDTLHRAKALLGTTQVEFYLSSEVDKQNST